MNLYMDNATPTRSQRVLDAAETGHSQVAAEIIAGLTAHERHEWRVRETMAAAAMLPMTGSLVTKEEVAQEMALSKQTYGIEAPMQDDALLMLALDLIGIGGQYNASGLATERVPTFGHLGAGRKQASDGGAWMAAAEEAAERIMRRNLIAHGMGDFMRDVVLLPYDPASVGESDDPRHPLADCSGNYKGWMFPTFAVRRADGGLETVGGMSLTPDDQAAMLPWLRALAVRGVLSLHRPYPDGAGDMEAFDSHITSWLRIGGTSQQWGHVLQNLPAPMYSEHHRLHRLHSLRSPDGIRYAWATDAEALARHAIQQGWLGMDVRSHKLDMRGDDLMLIGPDTNHAEFPISIGLWGGCK